MDYYRVTYTKVTVEVKQAELQPSVDPVENSDNPDLDRPDLNPFFKKVFEVIVGSYLGFLLLVLFL